MRRVQTDRLLRSHPACTPSFVCSFKGGQNQRIALPASLCRIFFQSPFRDEQKTDPFPKPPLTNPSEGGGLTAPCLWHLSRKHSAKSCVPHSSERRLRCGAFDVGPCFCRVAPNYLFGVREEKAWESLGDRALALLSVVQTQALFLCAGDGATVVMLRATLFAPAAVSCDRRTLAQLARPQHFIGTLQARVLLLLPLLPLLLYMVLEMTIRQADHHRNHSSGTRESRPRGACSP